MKTPGKWVVGMVASLSLATGAYAIIADPSGQTYKAIPERNLFGLREPPPTPPTPTEAPPPLPKVILTGLTTILGNKIAFLKVQTPGKPGVPAKEESLTLKEGERDGEIEVVDIDIPQLTVQVKNSGTLMPVTFDKLPPTPAPTATPGASATAAAIAKPVMPAPPIPNATNLTSTGIRELLNRRTIPTRSLRLPAPTSPTSPNLPLNGTQPVPPVPNGSYQPQTTGSQGNVTPAEEQLLQQLERQTQQNPANPAPQ